MFCERCGNKLPDAARFCPMCGYDMNDNQISNINNKYRNDRYNNEILLEIKSTFKFNKIFWPRLIFALLFTSPAIAMGIIIIMLCIKDGWNFIGVRFLVISIAIPLLMIIYVIVRTYMTKKEYENCVYIFYKDRLVCKDNYWNYFEKELKYKFITEVAKSSTRKFPNIGMIHLYCSTTDIYYKGMFIPDIENLDEIYLKIKKIINV